MRKAVLVVAVVVATALAGVAAPAAFAAPVPDVLLVSKAGTDVGNCQLSACLTITYALGQASSGATISVAAGTYTEQVNITKPVSLVGASASSTVLNGTGVTVACPQCGLLNIGDVSGPTWSGPVSVSGFTLQDPTIEPSQGGDIDVWIQAGPTAVNLSNNILRGNGDASTPSYGVFTQTLATPVNVSDSVFTGLWLGVFSEDGGAATVTGSTFTALTPISPDHGPAGVFVLSDSGTTMAGQTVSQNNFTGYAGYGVVLMAHYYAADDSTNLGSIANSTITRNMFNLGPSTDPLAAAIGLWADGNSVPSSDLTATISQNCGTVADPTQTIELVGGTGLHITQSANSFNPGCPTLQLTTDPAGLQLSVDGSQITAPYSTDPVTPGSQFNVTAPLSQQDGATTYEFSGWSDGGAANHDVTVNGPQTLTASYVVLHVPSAPARPTITRGNEDLSVAFDAPDNGGSIITGYTATCTSSNGGSTGTDTNVSSPIDVTGLTNGKNYTCSVDATNADGNSVDSAASIPMMVGNWPKNLVAPSITGRPVNHHTLTANKGTWSGAPTPTLTRQWKRCNIALTVCVAIPGSVGMTYVTRNADLSHRIRVLITARNALGATSMRSEATTRIVAVTTTSTRR